MACLFGLVAPQVGLSNAQPIKLVKTFDYDRRLTEFDAFAAVAYNPVASDTFYTALRSGEVAAWSESRLDPLWTRQLVDGGQNNIEGAAVSYDGKLLAVVGGKAFVRMVDTTSGTVLPIEYSTGTLSALPVQTHFTSVALSKDGRYMAAGDANGQIFVWDAAEPVALGMLRNLDYPINNLGFSENGQFLVSASGADVLLWNWVDRSIVVDFKKDRSGEALWAESIYLPPYERIMILTTFEDSVIYDIASRSLLKRYPFPVNDEGDVWMPVLTVVNEDLTQLWRFNREAIVQRLNLDSGVEEAAYMDVNIMNGIGLGMPMYNKVARKPGRPNEFAVGAFVVAFDFVTQEVSLMTRLRHYTLPE